MTNLVGTLNFAQSINYGHLGKTRPALRPPPVQCNIVEQSSIRVCDR